MLSLSFLCVLATAQPPSAALLPLASDERGRVGSELREALTSFEELALQTNAKVREALDTSKALGIACTLDKLECAVQVGGLSGAELAISGNTKVTDAGDLVNLRLVDVVRMTEVRRVTLTLASDPQERKGQLRLLVVRLVAPERERGAVDVRVNPAGATIVIDRVARGRAPLETPIYVTPGKHELYVAHFGFESVTESFHVGLEETITLRFELVPSEGARPNWSMPAVADGPDGDSSTANGPTEPVATSEKPAVRVAVSDVTIGQSLDARVGKIVGEALTAELRKLERTSVMSLNEVREQLAFEAEKQAMKCDTDNCLSEIADSLGVDILVTVSVARIGDSTLFGVRAYDQRTGSVVATASKNLVTGNGEELLAAIGGLVAAIFPDTPLRAGMKRGVDPALALRLNPPPLHPAIFWTGVGLTAIGVVTTALAGMELSTQRAHVDSLRTGLVLQSENGELEKTATEIEQVLTPTVVTASVASLVVATATGFVWFFTDFQGLASE